jgi:transcriptional regulator of acetoin/glycerol metabolism
MARAGGPNALFPGGTRLAVARDVAPGAETVFQELFLRALEARRGESVSLPVWLELAEAWRICEALREHRGNRSAAARALGIGRRTLYFKMKKLGIAASWVALRSTPADAGC